jgi:arylsulfatase A-like enzyme
VHGVTQTDGLGKRADDPRMRWLRPDEVPTLGHWFRAAGYDTHYDGKWHMSHADLLDPITREPIATNTREGEVIPEAVAAYLDADPLDPFGFSGWVGPEPHGPDRASCGVVRDPLLAARVVRWLRDRYARRQAGDAAARKPFLLVVSFVNPHDIVLFPMWRRASPLGPSPLDPPPVPEAPTQREDLRTKPAAQAAWRDAYASAYGPPRIIRFLYRNGAQSYRNLYYRLHAEVDGPLDRVRQEVERGSPNAVLVRSSDHGELLGAHGGLHQKWFNLYDEATRVPFVLVRLGERATSRATVSRTPTSHVDLVPTLLAAAGLGEGELAAKMQPAFSELHPLPGRNLMPLVEQGEPGEAGEAGEPGERGEATRAVYLLTRDRVLEGETRASGMARKIGLTRRVPGPFRIKPPTQVGGNFEAIVAAVAEREAPGGAGHLWKLVRSFDDPATWTEPGVRQLVTSGPLGDRVRTTALDDEWELYDLDTDPSEALNRAGDAAAAGVLGHLRARLVAERIRAVPRRFRP